MISAEQMAAVPDIENLTADMGDNDNGHAQTENGSTTTEPLVDAYPYGVEDGRIVRCQTVKEGTISVPLCNFDAQIKEEIV